MALQATNAALHRTHATPLSAEHTVQHRSAVHAWFAPSRTDQTDPGARQAGTHMAAATVLLTQLALDPFHDKGQRSCQWRREACGVDARNLCKIGVRPCPCVVCITLSRKFPFFPLPRACKYRKREDTHRAVSFYTWLNWLTIVIRLVK
jgi:hypothetical protein